jgi:Skp family chaperone for outer membrane proteins
MQGAGVFASCLLLLLGAAAFHSALMQTIPSHAGLQAAAAAAHSPLNSEQSARTMRTKFQQLPTIPQQAQF